MHSAIVRNGEGRPVAFDRREWRALIRDEGLEPDVVWALLGVVEVAQFSDPLPVTDAAHGRQ